MRRVDALQDARMLPFELLVRERANGVLGRGLVEFGEDADDIEATGVAAETDGKVRLLAGTCRRSHAQINQAIVLDAIRTDAEGYVHAPPGPGLGVRVDWEAVAASSLAHLEVR